ncbi:MAG TPA: hypothetical protein VLX91_05650 [Candidatus Acidoferrales bacterium]|nr:hypothetical protein [Candidatus Acidoferrales bacterium]
MAHATPEGLTQEQGALCILATTHLADLQKRGVTADFLTAYAAKLKTMQDAFAAHTGMTSDKEQLTVSEQVAKDQLLADVRRMQHGARRTFPKGSPQLKEFHVGEDYNRSTGLLGKWAGEIATAWDKYKMNLIANGNLIQDDFDSMVANAAVLKNTDAAQENAKHVDSPGATVAALSAMAAVEKAADFIYGAAEAAYAKDPAMLGEFEKLKPLRYAVPPRPKAAPQPPQPSAGTKK